MYWQKRFNRENPDKEIEDKILDIRKAHKDYGYRRIHAELRSQGMLINKKKVQRIVQKLGLQVTSFSRKTSKYNSYKGKLGRIAKNLINGRFHTDIVHQKITTDTSEFKYYEKDRSGKYQEKRAYLDPFLDMYNLEIICHSLTKKPDLNAIIATTKRAIEITKRCKYRRTFHSDQGWAYQLKQYSKLLKENKIFQSMSRKGNCLDNAPIENFFSIMKQEMYHGRVFYSFEELKEAINEYIKYYNEKRIKERLGYLSPVEYKKRNQKSLFPREEMNKKKIQKHREYVLY